MSDQVCAVVVTFNRKALLRECLHALQAQTHRIDTLLVVDNASNDGTPELLKTDFPGVETLHLAKNGGGAGGFHAGMKHAFEAGFDWIWIMDDDGIPAPNCLETMLEARSGEKVEVLVPIQRDSGGRPYGVQIWDKSAVEVTPQIMAGERETRGEYLFAFVGPLISRGVIESIGLPRPEFFIWFDDYEYGLRLQSRLGSRVVVVLGADFHHDLGGKTREVRLLGRKSLRNESPAWKTYYGSRNQLWTLLRIRHSPREIAWFMVHEVWLLLGDIVYETDRWRRVRLRARGLFDGVLGRMGKRVSP